MYPGLAVPLPPVGEVQWRTAKKRRRRERRNALLINPGEKKTFAEALKTLREGIDPANEGAGIFSVKRSRKGEILMELNNDSGEALEEKIRTLMGGEAKVLSLTPRMGLEIRDLDAVTTEEEVVSAVKNSCGESPECPYGDSDWDDAEHTFFWCDGHSSNRESLFHEIGVFTPTTVMNIMLENSSKWKTVAQYVQDVLRRKKAFVDSRPNPDNRDDQDVGISEIKIARETPGISDEQCNSKMPLRKKVNRKTVSKSKSSENDAKKKPNDRLKSIPQNYSESDESSSEDKYLEDYSTGESDEIISESDDLSQEFSDEEKLMNFYENKLREHCIVGNIGSCSSHSGQDDDLQEDYKEVFNEPWAKKVIKSNNSHTTSESEKLEERPIEERYNLNPSDIFRGPSSSNVSTSKVDHNQGRYFGTTTKLEEINRQYDANKKVVDYLNQIGDSGLVDMKMNIRKRMETKEISYAARQRNLGLVTMESLEGEYYNTTMADLRPKRDPLYIVVPMTILYSLIFVTGVVGNISTCIVIARNRHMHTATNYYLFSLAISDLLLLVSGLPQEMYYIWSRYPYVFGEAFCLLRGLAAETSANATVLTITAFTVERYVAICHPFLAHTISKLSRAVKFIIAIWIIALAFAIPQVSVLNPS
ncbi:hypothetical protein GE061_010840 [Apolygus lucorum]|uniref:G-protein coupled receptors family 1 profile domain-containing protein n=1 Tax=Apolygus lucorum TaxID=248454 RepID=A0A8S9XZV3_APOLU|nr:hypothetical protein GE061_010840 [Apolygus lucorum]